MRITNYAKQKINYKSNILMNNLKYYAKNLPKEIFLLRAN